MQFTTWALRRFVDTGWISSHMESVAGKAELDAAIDKAVEAYQRFFGLDAHGHLDRVTQDHMELQRFCKHPDCMSLTAEAITRPSKATFQFAGPSLPSSTGITDDMVCKAIMDAGAAWSAVAPVTLTEYTGVGQPSLVVSVAAIDGPAGVLADCEMPGPAIQRLRTDLAEKWVIQLGPMPAGKIDLLRVLTHELGHFWGLEHQPSGLMAPYISATIDKPQASDAAAMRKLYPGTTPVPPVPPTPSPGNPYPDKITIWDQYGGKIVTYKLVQIPS